MLLKAWHVDFGVWHIPHIWHISGIFMKHWLHYLKIDTKNSMIQKSILYLVWKITSTYVESRNFENGL